MPLHGAGAQEETDANLRVREPVASETGDLLLLGGQLVAGLDRPPAHRLAGGLQLATGALGEGLQAHVGEPAVRGPEPISRVGAPALPAQPFAVEQMRPGVLGPNPGTAE